MGANRNNSLVDRARGIALLGLMGLAGVAQGFDLQGHRGARGLMPENTLPAFAKALSIGVTTLELDLATTKDGAVVVIHNPRFEPELARTPEGDWLHQSSPAIHSMTLDQVKSYDVGRLNPASQYAQHYPDQQSVDGARVPTLDEVFELVNRAGNKVVRFNLEIKINPDVPELSLAPRAFVQTVLEVIRRNQMESRVVLQSFDWRALQQARYLAPEISTAYLTVSQSWLDNLQIGKPGPSPWMSGFDVDDFDASAARAIKAAGGVIWSPYHAEVSVESIRLAHQLGLLVNVWTVNDPTRMRELVEMGVDGIITDYPDRLRLVLEASGLPLPAPTPVRWLVGD